MKRLVAARRHRRDWRIPDMPPLALDGEQDTTAAAVTDASAQEIAGMRAGSPASPRPPPSRVGRRRPAGPGRADSPAIPQADGQTLLRLLGRPDGGDRQGSRGRAG